jgi:imidazolonepropionase-like amidohydrolase
MIGRLMARPRVCGVRLRVWALLLGLWTGSIVGVVHAADRSPTDADRTFLYDGEIRTFVPEAEVAKPIYIRGGTIINGTGAPPRENPGILVRDGRIEGIGTVDSSADATLIDASGKWILPGLFDLHAHITFHMPVGFHVEDDTLNALRSERFLELYQQAGITTVRDVASRNDIGYSLKRAQRMGLIGGSRLYVSGPGITVTGGHATEFVPYEKPVYAVEANGPWEMRQRVREAAKLGADFIKVLPPLTAEELNALVDESHYWGMRVTSHVGGVQDLPMVSAQRALAAGVDCLEHLYPFGDEQSTAMVLQSVVKRNVYVVPTLRYHMTELEGMTPEERLWMDKELGHSSTSILKLFSSMQRAGVKFGVGTDSNAPHMLFIGKLYQEELQWMIKGGLSAMQVIQAATLRSAEAMGLGAEAGSLENGKWGDLIITDEDPLSNIATLTAPNIVIQAGKLVHTRR